MDKYTVKLTTLEKALKTFEPETVMAKWSSHNYLAKVGYCENVIWLDSLPSNPEHVKMSWDVQYMNEATKVNIEKAAQKLISACNAIDLAKQAK